LLVSDPNSLPPPLRAALGGLFFLAVGS